MNKEAHKTLVIIPARAGSKRLQKKNSLSLLGKPLLEYSIDYAKSNFDIIDKIIVSTDDDEIKKLAQKNNIQIIDRPKELSDDKATTVSALKHALEMLDEEFENVVLLQPTNPCRPKDLLKKAFNEYLKNECDSLMTVSRNEDKLGKISNNKFIPFNYTIGQRSQDLEPLFFENGLLYITKASLILKEKISGANNHPYIVNHPFGKIDIDTQEDFDLAEFMLKKYKSDVH